MDIFLGIFLGSIFTGAISYFFYKRAGDKLLNEAIELKQINRLIIQTFELNGFEVARDETGRHVGIKVALTAKLNK